LALPFLFVKPFDEKMNFVRMREVGTKNVGRILAEPAIDAQFGKLPARWQNISASDNGLCLQ
jgi:hypothetical protein